MQEKLQKISQILSSKTVEETFLKEQISKLDLEITDLHRKTVAYDKAVSFCDLLIEKLNSASVEDIEKLVSEALEFIFEKPYKFKMKPEVLRGNVTYRFSLEIDGREDEDLMDSQGGGIVAVISIIMRIITILITEPPLKRVLFLDESLGMLSAEYIDNASKFIKQLGTKLGFKIILVTHQEAFKQHADTVYEVDKGSVRRIK